MGRIRRRGGLFNMETSLIYDALKIDESLFITSQMRECLKNLEQKEYDYIFNSVNNKEYNKIEGFIIKISHSSEDYDSNVKELSGLISLGVNYFKRSIEYDNFTFLLIFLIIKSSCEISFEEFIEYKKITREECYYWGEKVIKFLQECNIGFNYEENEIKGHLNRGFNNENLNEIYDYIFSIELKQNRIIFLLKELIYLVTFIDFNKFISVYSKVDTPQKAILYLRVINEKNLLKIADESYLDNKWLNFELIRQILECIGENNIKKEEKYEIVLIKMINNIFSEDFNFFKQMVYYFRNYKMFNISLGSFLANCSKEELNKISKYCFKIDLFKNLYSQKKLILNSFHEKCDKDKYLFLITCVYHNWCNLLDESKKLDYVLIELILSDYYEFIKQYPCLIFRDDEILEKLTYFLLKIKYIESEWFSSQTILINNVYIYLSQIYMLSYAYNYKNLKNKEIEKLFWNFRKNKIIYQRYNLFRIETELKKIENNLIEE